MNKKVRIPKRCLRLFDVVFLLMFACFSMLLSTEVLSQRTTETADDIKTAAESNDSETYSMRNLRSDFRLADSVLYIDVKEKKLVDQIGTNDCEDDKGTGECLYILRAEVIEIFKGNIKSKLVDFYESADANYPKRYFMGKRVVFLIVNDRKDGKPANSSTIENSGVRVRGSLLAKLRSIKSGVGRIDEEDDDEPYSKVSIKATFDEADVAVLADVLSFRADLNDLGVRPMIVTARIREVFKGKLRPGQTVEYKEDRYYRELRKGDLGMQVLYLTLASPSYTYSKFVTDKTTGETVKTEESTNPERISYEKVDAEGQLMHGILHKLRTLAKKPKSK